MHDRPSDLQTTVLIVGAGPTGLTLACRLATLGVGFRIIDRPPGKPRNHGPRWCTPPPSSYWRSWAPPTG
jgi:2-polyprenyl-6-methoxyphenol hydroxylase-like FAD-dependent oxidoreductase